MKCPVIDCVKEIYYGRKTCEMHYYRMRRTGDYQLKPKKTRSKKLNFTISKSGCFVVSSRVPQSNGYFMMKFNGFRKSMHRHVYEECFGEIPEGMYVCHKCDNKGCINPEHLELGTHEKNTKDAVDRGLYRRGSTHVHSKLTDEQVVSIKTMLREKVKNIDIARKFGAHRDTISDIKRGKSWKHILTEVPHEKSI